MKINKIESFRIEELSINELAILEQFIKIGMESPKFEGFSLKYKEMINNIYLQIREIFS